jgi:hypothetical protein
MNFLNILPNAKLFGSVSDALQSFDWNETKNSRSAREQRFITRMMRSSEIWQIGDSDGQMTFSDTENSKKAK